MSNSTFFLDETDRWVRADQRRERLRSLLWSVTRFGQFRLRSGARSTYFIDAKQVTLSAEGAVLVGVLIEEMFRDLDVDAVGGLTLGADPIATAVAAESWRQERPVDAFVIRKEAKDHGMADQIVGPLRPGSRVVVVDDVMTTGGAAQRAVDVLTSNGHTVLRVLALVDRLAGAEARFRSQGLDFGALFTIRDLGIEPEAVQAQWIINVGQP